MFIQNGINLRNVVGVLERDVVLLKLVGSLTFLLLEFIHYFTGVRKPSRFEFRKH